MLLIFERAVRDKTERVKLDYRLDHRMLLTSMLLDDSFRFSWDPVKKTLVYIFTIALERQLKKIYFTLDENRLIDVCV